MIPDLPFTFDRGLAVVSLPKGYELRFDYLRMERGELHAELTVTNGVGPVLAPATFNLSSLQTRERWARTLGGSDFESWHQTLEAACVKVHGAYRAGSPAILLRDVKPRPDDGMILSPLLRRRDPVALFGDGGSAKSYLGLALALTVHTGLPLVGALKPSAMLRTAYLDFEWDAEPHAERMRKLLGEDGLPDLLYVPGDGPLERQVDRLRRIFAENRIEYAVIDSVMLACDGPAEEADTVRRFFQALSRLEVGAALIAHVTKAGEEDKPFGSVFWHNSVRGSWFVQKAQENGADSLLLGLHNKKPQTSRLQPSLGLRFDFGERTTITRADVFAEPDLAVKLPVKARLVDALSKGSLTVAELADRLDAHPETIRTTMKRDPRRFVALSEGRWGLPQ